MKKYDKYKDSGIEWLGQIPEHWEVVNFRYLIKILTDFTANGSFGDLAKNVDYLDEGYSRLIRLTDLRANFENSGIYLSEKAHKYLSKSELFGGELLLANVGAYAGLAWIFKNFYQKASLGPNMFLIRFNDKLINDFAYISLISDYLHNQLLNKATSSAQPKLNKDDVRSCLFILPPLPEQTAIAAFLDHKTAQIDAIIDKKEQLIAKLKLKRQAVINEAVTKGLNPNAKMKDSGIEWLGEIPEHWEVIRIKHVADVNPTKSEISDKIKEDELVSFLPMEKVGEDWNIDLSLNRKLSEVYSGFTYFRNADIIIAKITPCFENGKGAIVNEITNGIGFGSTEFHVVRTQNINVLFLSYILRADIFMTNGEASMVGAAGQKRVPTSFIENFYIGLPTDKEQKDISELINEKVSLIDKSVSKVNEVIDKLKLYRQSIISEAVTGKIDVRDWAKNQN